MLNASKFFRTSYLDESEGRSEFKWAIFWMIVFALAGLFFISQTRWFVSFFTPPGGLENIPAAMEADRKVQEQLRNQYRLVSKKEPPQKIIFNSLFAKKEIEDLEAARDSLINDEQLQSELKQNFGVSFKELHAVVVPAWELHKEANRHQFGLSEVCWKAAERVAGASDVGGYTVRDSTEFKGITDDGTPRIILNHQAFGSKETLRRALFHEMLHAMNVPRYSPYHITINSRRYDLSLIQSDLTYLPLYRAYLKRAHLARDEFLIWCFLVVLPFTISLINLFKVFR